jgi:hypothetical protein
MYATAVDAGASYSIKLDGVDTCPIMYDVRKYNPFYDGCGKQLEAGRPKLN